jgi:sec-independent protein translocase protein TatC
MTAYFLEARNRLFFVIVSFSSSIIVTYSHKETLLFLLIKPHQKINLAFVYFIFTDVTEVFLVYIHLINFISLQFLFLYFIYYCFTFLIPALSKKEYYFLSVFLKIGLVVWGFSAILFNYFVIPLTWGFFFSFQDIISNKLIHLHFEAKLNEYLNFYTSLYYICVFYCQIFTVLFFVLGYFEDSVKIIRKSRKLYYYFFIIFSTITTPPDVFSQVFISVGLVIVYEVFIFNLILKNELIR